jgi:hypothetical protein
MKLSSFVVVHERGDASPMLDHPLVHCFAEKQIVLAYISRQALMDYFQISGERRISLKEWNLVVNRNLDAFKPIIESKFERDEWEIFNAYRQSYPKIIVTLEDMQRSGEQFTISVLDLKAGWQR